MLSLRCLFQLACAAGATATLAADPPSFKKGVAPENIELAKAFTVTATIKNVIGSFNSPGSPQAGESFELDLAHLPKEKILFTAPPLLAKSRTSSLPFDGPLIIEQARQGAGTTRGAINLSAAGKFRMQIVAEELKPGSPVMIFAFQESGFVGGMFQAEGVLK